MMLWAPLIILSSVASLAMRSVEASPEVFWFAGAWELGRFVFQFRDVAPIILCLSARGLGTDLGRSRAGYFP